MDSVRGDLSYCLHLLVGFDLVKVDHGGRVSAMGGVGPLVIVEGDPAPDACLGLRSGFPGMHVDAFILQGPPEALDEDVVEAAPLAADAVEAKVLISRSQRMAARSRKADFACAISLR